MLTDQDADPFATMCSGHASILEQAFDPVFTTMDFDVDARRGEIHACDGSRWQSAVVESATRPE